MPQTHQIIAVAGVIMVAVTQVGDVMKVNDEVNVVVMKMMTVVMVVMSAVVMTGVIPSHVTSIHQNCSHLQK